MNEDLNAAALEISHWLAIQIAANAAASKSHGLPLELKTFTRRLKAASTKQAEHKILIELASLACDETGQGNPEQIAQIIAPAYARIRSQIGRIPEAIFDVWLEDIPSPGAKPFTVGAGDTLYWARSDESPLRGSSDQLLASHQAAEGLKNHGPYLIYTQVHFIDFHGQCTTIGLQELAALLPASEPEKVEESLSDVRSERKRELAQILKKHPEPDAVTALHVVNAHTKELTRLIQKGERNILPLLAQRERLYQLKEYAAESMFRAGILKYAGEDAQFSYNPHLVVGMTPFGEKAFHVRLSNPPAQAQVKAGPPGSREEARFIAAHTPLQTAVKVLEQHLRQEGKMLFNPPWQGVIHGFNCYV